MDESSNPNDEISSSSPPSSSTSTRPRKADNDAIVSSMILSSSKKKNKKRKRIFKEEKKDHSSSLPLELLPASISTSRKRTTPKRESTTNNSSSTLSPSPSSLSLISTSTKRKSNNSGIVSTNNYKNQYHFSYNKIYSSNTSAAAAEKKIKWHDPDETFEIIQDICNFVQTQRFQKRHAVLSNALTTLRDDVLKQATMLKKARAIKRKIMHQQQHIQHIQHQDDNDSNDEQHAMLLYPQLPTTTKKFAKSKDEDNCNDNGIDGDNGVSQNHLCQEQQQHNNNNTTNEEGDYDENYNHNHNHNHNQNIVNTNMITFKELHQNVFKSHLSIHPIYIEGTRTHQSTTATTTTTTTTVATNTPSSSHPASTATIFLQKHYAVDDQKELTFLPYFGDGHITDENIDDIKDLFDLQKREDMWEYGPDYYQDEMNAFVTQVFTILLDDTCTPVGKILKHYRRRSSSSSSSGSNAKGDLILSNLFELIAQIKDFKVSQVQEIYKNYMTTISSSSSRNSNSRRNINKNKNKKNYDNSDALSNQASKNEQNNKGKRDDDNNNNNGEKQQQNGNKIVKNSNVMNDKGKHTIHYEDAMDSFRALFCRQCFVYDCNIHGNLPPANLTLQTNLAIEKELKHGDNGDKEIMIDSNDMEDISHGRYWYPTMMQSCIPCKEDSRNTNTTPIKKSISALSNSDDNMSSKSIQSENNVTSILSPLHKVISHHAYQIFCGDEQQLASIFQTKKGSVLKYTQEQHITLDRDIKKLLTKYKMRNSTRTTSSSTASPSPSSSSTTNTNKTTSEPQKKKTKTMKYYNSTWLKRVQNSEIHPAFYPCTHEEPCSDDTCSCVQNAIFCTKHCAWGPSSRNMFRGCMCKNGQCNTNACPCFAAHRECDPDLCGSCLACLDPPNQVASSNQRCRNDNISMRRHSHLLLSESGVPEAGWGIYNKYFLKRGSFVHEYVGELISQDEAERRGVLYDKINRSYLFNLTSDTVIDASRKGNKMKFANHKSEKPNCYAKIITVNGDSRVGLFAKEDIEPQTELFFDYAYDMSMNNDLIQKTGIVLDWMKVPKMKKKVIAKKKTV